MNKFILTSALLLAINANANTIVHFSGTVTSGLANNNPTTFSIGDPISGQFELVNGIADVANSVSTGDFNFGAINLSLNLNGDQVTSDSGNKRVLLNDNGSYQLFALFGLASNVNYFETTSKFDVDYVLLDVKGNNFFQNPNYLMIDSLSDLISVKLSVGLKNSDFSLIQSNNLTFTYFN